MTRLNATLIISCRKIYRISNGNGKDRFGLALIIPGEDAHEEKARSRQLHTFPCHLLPVTRRKATEVEDEQFQNHKKSLRTRCHPISFPFL